VKTKNVAPDLISRTTGFIATRVRNSTARTVPPGHGNMKLGIVNIKKNHVVEVTPFEHKSTKEKLSSKSP